MFPASANPIHSAQQGFLASQHVTSVVTYVLALLAASSGAAADKPQANARAADTQFAERLESLAAKCRELNLPDQERITRHWLISEDPGRQYFYLPDDQRPIADERGSRLVQPWAARFREYRVEYAEALFEQARQAAEARDEAAAYQLLHRLLHHDPAHEPARRTLGHRRTAAGWQTPGKKPAVRQARLAHPEFSWPARRYWRIESDHYVVTTNHSPQAGLELAEQLELLHSVWQQAFYRYWSPPGLLAARLRGDARDWPPVPTRQVVLFADRDQYVRQLSRGEPQIAVTVGYYSAQNRRAYFYASDTPDVATWYHEAAHQLFHESPNVAPEVGEHSNFWMVEGIALYMESLVRHDGHATLGGFEANRLQFARYRTLSEGFALPLAELVSLGRAELQKHEDLRPLYSQAAGLAHLLMDGEAGRYRQATIDYLAALYRGTADSTTLAQVTGVPLADLDMQYRRFLNVTDGEVARLVAPERLHNLALGKTKVTDQSLATIGHAKQLKWLDLSGTAVTDSGLAELVQLSELSQLTLIGTKVTDEATMSLGRLTAIEELNLANTAVTDAGLANLKTLSRLKSLDLTNTAVTDVGLDRLAELPSLESLDIRGTQVTEAGRQRLQQRRPKLQIDFNAP